MWLLYLICRLGRIYPVKVGDGGCRMSEMLPLDAETLQDFVKHKPSRSSLFWELGQCQTFADLDSLRDKHPSAHGSFTWKRSCRAWNDRCYSLTGTQLLLQRPAEVTGLSVSVSLRGFEPASQSCSPALHFMPLVFCRLCILAGESTCCTHTHTHKR